MEGVRKAELNSTQVWGFLSRLSSAVKVWAWESRLNRRKTCPPPLLTASVGPNEALIRGVGCCSLGKHGVSKPQWKRQQRAGGRRGHRVSVPLNCTFSNHFKSSVTEYSPDFNEEHMKGPLNTFVGGFFPFYTKVINPPFTTLTPPRTHTCTHCWLTPLLTPVHIEQFHFYAHAHRFGFPPEPFVWLQFFLHGAFSDWQINRGMLNLFVFKNKNIKEHGAGKFYLY